MTTNGIHPLLAAQIARYRADDLVREANDSRRAKLARRRGRRPTEPSLDPRVRDSTIAAKATRRQMFPPTPSEGDGAGGRGGSPGGIRARPSTEVGAR